MTIWPRIFRRTTNGHTAPPIRRVSPEPSRFIYPRQFFRGLLLVLFVLFATWNRSGYSYVAWVMGAPHFTALMAVVGIALLIAYVVILRIAYVALGYAGIVAATVLIGMLLLVAWHFDLIRLDELTHHVEFWMFAVASILSIGVGWAKYQQRLSGQRDALKSPP